MADRDRKRIPSAEIGVTLTVSEAALAEIRRRAIQQAAADGPRLWGADA